MAKSTTTISASSSDTRATRLAQPLILIRGFGGLGVEDEKRIAYQGFNDGTVYPRKRGENYIYEGLILRFMKSQWSYHDATNVVGYYGEEMRAGAAIPQELAKLQPGFFTGDKVVIDAAMASRFVSAKEKDDLLKSLWVFRYYDLNNRKFPVYGKALVRLIEFIRELVALRAQDGRRPKVNIIAHSMGGLIVREAIQSTFPAQKKDPQEYINKIVTLGTPHKGISFQLLQKWIAVDAQDDLEAFNPKNQEDKKKATSYVNFSRHFPPERVLTVIGTNYRTYGVTAASWLNRAFSVEGEYGANYNRSDGLVKQSNAELPGAPRTFVHKCHGGPDSLVTSREAFEVATRFLFGDIKVKLNLVSAKVMRGFDIIGKSQFFFGVGIKPRGVDFDLFHQSAEAENCYGPFDTDDLSGKATFDWAGADRLIWEGWLNTGSRAVGVDRERIEDRDGTPKDIVMRLDVYVGERDLLGFRFSDNIVFRQQYFVRAVFDDIDALRLADIELHTQENVARSVGTPLTKAGKGWTFDIGDDKNFRATLGLSFDIVDDVG